MQVLLRTGERLLTALVPNDRAGACWHYSVCNRSVACPYCGPLWCGNGNYRRYSCTRCGGYSECHPTPGQQGITECCS